jgi:Alginate lyase
LLTKNKSTIAAAAGIRGAVNLQCLIAILLVILLIVSCMEASFLQNNDVSAGGGQTASLRLAEKDQGEIPRTFLIKPSLLLDIKQAIRTDSANNSELKSSLSKIIQMADSFLTAHPHSVVDKSQLPPSGDKHDFLALSPYGWPNPSKEHGLPYIIHDGVINPEINSVPDKRNLDDMIYKVKILSAAYYFTDEGKYVSKLKELLHVWFLDQGSKMNPNLKYGELLRGINTPNSYAIMAGRNLTDLVDAIGLVQYSPIWTRQDQDGMNLWFARYLDWLLNSIEGKKESQKISNHGTYYDVQVSSIALFLNKTDLAKKTIEDLMHKELALKIQPDGSQPYELRRTRALDYSMFNLLGLFKVAGIGEHLGIDLWNFKTSQGSGIQGALDYLMPYLLENQTWPFPQIVPIRATVLDDMLCMAITQYQNKSYVQAYTSVRGSNAIVPDIEDLVCKISSRSG